jgi:Ca2+-transporting ATPase
MDWYQKTIREVLALQKVSPSQGLSEEQVRIRLEKFGPNILKKHRRFEALGILLRQFKSPLIYILILAGVVTFFLERLLDTIVIFAAVGVNGVVGFFQEFRASKAFENLRKLVRHQALVRRGGAEHFIEAAYVVPGDILILAPGDRVAADARLIKSRALEVDESRLTGEAYPVSKTVSRIPGERALGDQSNLVFWGTTVQRGEAEAVVVATGSETQLGQVAHLVAETREDLTPFQLKVQQLGRLVGLITLIIIGVILLSSVFSSQYSFIEILITSVAVAVAVVPEALPVALTVVLAVAAGLILKRKGLIRRLVAAETLGSASLIATDKTGTLTQGTMALKQVQVARQVRWPGFFPKGEKGVLYLAGLNTEAVLETKKRSKKVEIQGSLTDKALARAALKAGIDLVRVRKSFPLKARLMFDRGRKYAASVWEVSPRDYLLITSGAPEKLLTLSRLNKESIQKHLKQIEGFAGLGLRVIGVGFRLIPKDSLDFGKVSDEFLESLVERLDFAGLLVLEDPIRRGAARAIKQARQAGVRTIMVTGDHPLTARAIGKELGFGVLPGAVMIGEDLEQISFEALVRKIETIQIFARVSPAHKLKIVGAWQARGAVVAMTGDGVNDAPALKKADIGVALGSGTEVAKEASDLVLLDDNFATIVESIRQGRTVFDNMKRTALYLLAGNFSESILILGSILLGLPLAILPAQILWINLVTDSLPAFSPAFEPSRPEVMKRKPRPKQSSIFNLQDWAVLLVIGFLTGPILLGLYWWFFYQGIELDRLRTLIFAGVTLLSLVYIFSIRVLSEPIWRLSLFSNRVLLWGAGFGWLTLISGVYFPPFQRLLRTVPLSLSDWAILAVLGAILIGAIEITKFLIKPKLQSSKNILVS